MANKPGYCWCGAQLITGIITESGEWFPFGFANCPSHTCWFESEEDYREHLAGVRERSRRKRST